MITTIYTMHTIDADHLARVIDDMRTMGAPTIRVVDCTDYYVAIEGTHRMAACAALGVAPVLDVLAQDELVGADSLDWQDLCSGEQYTAGELAGEAYSPSCGIYTLRDDGTVQ